TGGRSGLSTLDCTGSRSDRLCATEECPECRLSRDQKKAGSAPTVVAECTVLTRRAAMGERRAYQASLDSGMASRDDGTARRWTLVATILASSMTFIDGTVVNVALPALQKSLDATITDVQWVIEAYALFLGALILVGGSLGDQLGRRRVFLFGVISFTAGS